MQPLKACPASVLFPSPALWPSCSFCSSKPPSYPAGSFLGSVSTVSEPTASLPEAAGMKWPAGAGVWQVWQARGHGEGSMDRARLLQAASRSSSWGIAAPCGGTRREHTAIYCSLQCNCRLLCHLATIILCYLLKELA